MVQQAGGISPHNIHSRRHRPAHVLLVDDDHALLEALAGTLQVRLGHFTLDTCDTGMKALARVTEKHYDTIITDVNMPGMNGLEFLTQVKQVRPLTPVVLISGHAEPAVVSKAIDAGAADFIVKPIERDVFMWTVRQTLNLSRLRLLSDHRLAIISRALEHYLRIVERLGHSNKKRIGSLENILKGDSVRLLPHARLGQEKAEEQMDIFTKRTTRHLAILDAFLLKATQAHRQTSEEFNMAQEKLRRLALTRLQGS
jgi:YesN/AraC family two-component response regulator